MPINQVHERFDAMHARLRFRMPLHVVAPTAKNFNAAVVLQRDQMSSLPELSESAFEKEVLQADYPVIVEFSNDGCGICRLIAPALEQVADEYAGEAKVFVVDTDNSPGLAARFDIQSVPQIFAFSLGEVKERVIGNISRGRLAQMIESCLGAP